MKICKVEGCDKRLNKDNTHGYCRNHRYRKRPSGGICAEPNCKKTLRSDNTTGYCQSHNHKSHLIKTWHKQHYQKNRDKELEYRKQHYKENSDYWKQRYQKNCENELKYRKQRHESKKLGHWIVYGVHLPGETNMLYIGQTEFDLDYYHMMGLSSKKRGIGKVLKVHPNAILQPLVSNISTLSEALQLENENIIKYNTIENGYNTNMNRL